MNRLWFRISGLSGILGGLVLFAGDMLLYYNDSGTDLLKNMGNSSDLRIILSGISALVATWLYLIGLSQVYYAFKPSSVNIIKIVVICFAAIFIIYGIVHAEYIAIAVTAKLSIQNQLNIAESTKLATQTNNILRLFAYPFFAVLSFLFIKQVWIKKTLYPRWIILFFPLIPFLFKDIVSSLLSGRAWLIIMGGYLNLLIVFFFLASTISLWNKYPGINENKNKQ